MSNRKVLFWLLKPLLLICLGIFPAEVISYSIPNPCQGGQIYSNGACSPVIVNVFNGCGGQTGIPCFSVSNGSPVVVPGTPGCPNAPKNPIVDPINPVYPSDPSNPIVNPVNPLCPNAPKPPIAEPIAPINPIAPTNPTVPPVNPLCPNAPKPPIVDPLDPIYPSDPTNPNVDPLNPVHPSDPTNPIVNPTNPLCPNAPKPPIVDPVTPGCPNAPANPIVVPPTQPTGCPPSSNSPCPNNCNNNCNCPNNCPNSSTPCPTPSPNTPPTNPPTPSPFPTPYPTQNPQQPDSTPHPYPNPTAPTIPPPAPITICPKGTILVRGNCRLLFCGGHGIYNEGRCVQARCPAGYIWTGLRCSKPQPVDIGNIHIENNSYQTSGNLPHLITNNVNNVKVNASIVLQGQSSQEEEEEEEEVVVPRPPAGPCCNVVAPRICTNQADQIGYKCFSRTQQQCGSFCSANKVVLAPSTVTTWTQDNAQMVVMPPNWVGQGCQSTGGICQPAQNFYDCSGCAMGDFSTCSSYCYSYKCSNHNCAYYDQGQYCSQYPGQIGCRADDGWFPAE
ncbi:leucine-rich repeat extensin-like protein 5 [Drosophila ficusphila]|uniref:leucine-rich repeat extensin-like protein 5 n=1 Tax=Drosophila ficusphila TaxID=30025 RepID=UPI0007E5FB83|nr:leucine-rich repeat extensin-like protein 5 [Drosophila ficusphila]